MNFNPTYWRHRSSFFKNCFTDLEFPRRELKWENLQPYMKNCRHNPSLVTDKFDLKHSLQTWM